MADSPLRLGTALVLPAGCPAMMPFAVPTCSYLLTPGDDAADVVARLAKLLPRTRRGASLDAASSRPALATNTVVDTVDRRLRAAGLGLVLEAGAGRRGRLVLREGPGTPTVVAEIARVGRRYRAADLPAGRLRDRVAPIMGVRALLPMVEIRRRAVPVDVRNRDGKTVARLSVADLWAVPPTAQAPVRLSGRLELSGILGYAKPFERIDALLRDRLGLSEAAGDLADDAVAALGGDPAGAPADVEVKLRPDESAESAARRILVWLAEVVEANLSGTLADLDPEFLHDLRVAVRRSRAVLRELKQVFEPDVRREHADALRWIQVVTGPTRDLDVQLLEWDDLVAQVSEDRRGELAPVHEVLVARRAAAFRAMRTTLRGAEYRRRWAAWREFLGSDFGPPQPRPDALRPVREVAGRRIQSVYRRMVRDGQAIDVDSPAQALHDLRKRGKELRYLLELFGALWPKKQVKPVVTSLKQLQDVLGRHQDCEVQAANLRSLAPELAGVPAGAEALLAMGSLIDRLEADQRAAREQFADRFAAFAQLKVPT